VGYLGTADESLHRFESCLPDHDGE
jgi:hypothetical protein